MDDDFDYMTEDMINKMEEEYWVGDEEPHSLTGEMKEPDMEDYLEDDEPCSDDFNEVLTGEEIQEPDYFGDGEPSNDDFEPDSKEDDEIQEPGDYGEEEHVNEHDEPDPEDLYRLFHDDDYEPCCDDFVPVPTDPESETDEENEEEDINIVVPPQFDSDDEKAGEEYTPEQVELYRRIQDKNN